MNCSGSLAPADTKECEQGFTDCSNSLLDDGTSDWKGLPGELTISFLTLDIEEGELSLT